MRYADNRAHWQQQPDIQCYIFQETVNLDFDIIDVSFTDDTLKETVLPVIANPIDNIPEPTPPIDMDESGGVPWLTISIILIVSVAGIAVPRIIKHYTSQIKTGGKRA